MWIRFREGFFEIECGAMFHREHVGKSSIHGAFEAGKYISSIEYQFKFTMNSTKCR